jgi:hypothetical protein
MSEPKGVKTLGIKVPDALHAQFALVAQLDGISLGDAALRAVELYVNTKRAESDFAARAEAALEEIEREAAARRGAIQGLFGENVPSPTEAAASDKPATTRTRRSTNCGVVGVDGSFNRFPAPHSQPEFAANFATPKRPALIRPEQIGQPDLSWHLHE